MERPSLLYASPFPPMKSGISDYSEELIQDLARKFDITLFTDDYNISNKINKNLCFIPDVLLVESVSNKKQEYH